MRIKTVLFLFISVFNFICFTPTFAITSVTNSPINSIVEKQNTDLKNAFKTHKKSLKQQRFLEKMGINLNSSADKWLWYGLGFLALSVVMSVLPVVRSLAGLIALIGVILIIYWLIKKLGI